MNNSDFSSVSTPLTKYQTGNTPLRTTPASIADLITSKSRRLLVDKGGSAFKVLSDGSVPINGCKHEGVRGTGAVAIRHGVSGTNTTLE